MSIDLWVVLIMVCWPWKPSGAKFLSPPEELDSWTFERSRHTIYLLQPSGSQKDIFFFRSKEKPPITLWLSGTPTVIQALRVLFYISRGCKCSWSWDLSTSLLDYLVGKIRHTPRSTRGQRAPGFTLIDGKFAQYSDAPFKKQCFVYNML